MVKDLEVLDSNIKTSITSGRSILRSDVDNQTLLFENLKWLNSCETVTYLRLPSLGALRQLVYRRRIPFYKLGRNLRFNKEDLDLFIESSISKRRFL